MSAAARPARHWCAWALPDSRAGGAAQPGVLVETAGGVITAVSTGTAPPPDAERLDGLVVAGLANAHSHAFHRALRGRTGEDGGSFWTWRDAMYRVAARLDPDSYHRLARAVYAEMALAGVTCVGEFHYVHHDPAGRRYADPNAMGAALVAAAADAGIRITLLDTCYLAGGLDGAAGHAPLEGPQARFGDTDADTWAARVAAFEPGGGHARLGAAVHSVRAVPRDQIARITAIGAEAGWPAVHVHLSEQPAENAACRAFYGATPARLLADTGFLDRLRPTLVHATHLTPQDAALVRAAGARVCLCPTTERDLADGLPDLAALRGTALALGSDGHSAIDLWEEARGAEMHERLRTGRRGTLAAADLLTALHTAGHAALGWAGSTGERGAEAGRIAAGARADLVVLGLDGVRLAGFDPARAADAAVFAATAADVRHVMADGRWIVRDGVHTLIPDAPAQLDAAVREVAA
ncbi:formimidoylglutamate deiminase [Streptomonospora nanhaiensis]|uniref:Formiminoglutamate deiminase n=1 Tax=Streptomonospora nanhaiensis TaxID=1323731 RepID=A0A853BWP9_9ACTN|nr:formimidoylglutamate deiminase [Streptomonospora nanhaiensis]NYI98901.1 formiminoglutamate deiminase [Streptomonospora nanhaiensis]